LQPLSKALGQPIKCKGTAIFKILFTIILTWLITSTLIGYISAVIYGEHGAIVFVILGFWVSIIGATINSLQFSLFNKTHSYKDYKWLMVSIVTSLVTIASITTDFILSEREAKSVITNGSIIFTLIIICSTTSSFLVNLMLVKLSNLTNSSSGTTNP